MSFSPRAQHLAARLRPRSRRQLVVAVVVVALVIGGVGYWFVGRSDGAEAQATVSTVESGTFQQSVTGSGTLASAKQADLDFAVSGRITSVEVEAGDKVKKGDVLATLDTVSLDAALASAQAQAEAAATTVANDGSDSATQQAANSASLVSAQADVTQAEEDLDAATLTAPFSGTIATVTIEVGDQAGSSSSGSSSTGAGGGQGATGTGTQTSSSTSSAAMTLIKPTRFVVDVDIAAADIENVKAGLQAEITPAGASEAIFGTVKSVGRVAETSTSGTATFPVTIGVTGNQKDLYIGTSADVSIIVKQVEDVLTVPTQALTTTGGKTYVTLVSGSSTKKTEVTVGETYGMSTEITKGVKAGDQVQVAAAGRIRTGGTGGTGNGGQGLPSGGFPGGGAPPGGAGGGFPAGGPQ